METNVQSLCYIFMVIFMMMMMIIQPNCCYHVDNSQPTIEPKANDSPGIMNTFVNFIRTVDDFIEFLRSLPYDIRRTFNTAVVNPISELFPSNSTVGVSWWEKSWLNRTLNDAYSALNETQIKT